MRKINNFHSREPPKNKINPSQIQFYQFPDELYQKQKNEVLNYPNGQYEGTVLNEKAEGLGIFYYNNYDRY